MRTGSGEKGVKGTREGKGGWRSAMGTLEKVPYT